MKKYLSIICVLSLILIGCADESMPKTQYRYAIKNIVPDSLRNRQAKWIKEAVRATNHKLTAGDYEDPEDVINTAKAVSDNLFGKMCECLEIQFSSNVSSDFIPFEQLTEHQKLIFLNIRCKEYETEKE